MPLKEAAGNMYPWVTHVHTHLGGECPHKCTYCYVDSRRFGRPPRYAGPRRLLEEELTVDYGSGRVIFIEHMNDLFAGETPYRWVLLILKHCREFPANHYVFQTKNPWGFYPFENCLPPRRIVGTTIETNRAVAVSTAPAPIDRLKGMLRFACPKFVTIEPIMDFDIDTLVSWMVLIHPVFVNIGADSQGHKLPEPPPDKIRALIAELKARRIEVREKPNLQRLFARC
jgi:DNA repair photolyase